MGQQERTKDESDQRNVTRRLEDELHCTGLQLELARQEEMQLEQQCRAQQRRNNEDQLQLRWALDAARLIAVAGDAAKGSASRGDLTAVGKACSTSLAMVMSGNNGSCGGIVRSSSCPGVRALTAR